MLFNFSLCYEIEDMSNVNRRKVHISYKKYYSLKLMSLFIVNIINCNNKVKKIILRLVLSKVRLNLKA